MLADKLKIPSNASEDLLFKKMVNWSVLIHAAVFLFMGIKTFVFPTEPLNTDAAIRVDIVDLPDKIDKLPEDLGPKPAPKPEAKTQPPEPKIEKAAPKPAPVVLHPKAKEKDALKKIEQFKKEEERKRHLEDIRKQVEQDEAKERSEKRQKALALLKGNQVSPGTALQGLQKAEFNEYIGQLRNHMQAHWSLPEWLQNDNLKATVIVYIDRTGQVVRRDVKRSSGDPRFDDYALKAVDEASPFPKPPDKFVDLVRVDGILLGFPQ